MVIASATLLNVTGLIRKNYVNSLYKQVREQKLKAFSRLLLLVTFKDLQKVIESESHSNPEHN